MLFIRILTIGSGLLMAAQCVETNRPASRQTPSSAGVVLPAVAGDSYWFQGKAELSSFEVEQERYGEKREAGQVMVFVTEDFSEKKQVKLDGEPAPDDRRIPVLKLNTVRRFKTGIYDYSLMQSVFSPIEPAQKAALKTTTTIQDWCGHVFVQCNWKGEKQYAIQQNSYFESEGDWVGKVQPDMLEDEIWTRIRLNPDALACDDCTVLPGMFYARMRHKPIQPEKAAIQIESGERENKLVLAYKNIPRRLTIRYEPVFPYRILGWEEVFDGVVMSKGVLKKVMLDAYWSHNDNASAPLRAELNPWY